ncbi:amino acid adenylation domain-containing protein, partial [bacterium]|nr:amino acid adenylation domain-containing protein [bacterium]
STSHVSAPAQERQEKPKNIEPRVGGAERFRSLHVKPTGPMTDEQKSFVENLVRQHIARTPTSKSMTQNSRPVLADWKHTLSYWGQLKEGKYPIISSRSQGPRFWDVDGNEYIDVAMGMGVHFLGHTPPAIKQEIERQLSEGMEIGTQCDLTGEIARLITELTGNERVTFCNTGSEAVMVCLRLARAVTQRTKIVIFENSYHGIFDGVLAMNVNGQKVPIGLGTPQGMIEDVVVLKYGHPDSLQFIQDHANELAGVLVEPVQSRNPDLQPQNFLKKLRRLTQEVDIALIFDEMITGFRVHPGGAQHWFGVRADICAYGKIVGGGLPIGVVAGKSKYLDYIDGGYWEYGDQSGPRSAMIFFGGTFGRNPMTMASAHAALQELKRQGPQLQQAVSQRTRQFCNRLNHWLEQERVPMRVKSFASQWRLVPLAEEDRQPLEMELLFLQLMVKGIYTWERRICFFSAAHGEEEINYVLNSIKESIAELRQNGFPFAMDGDVPRSFVSPTSIQTRLYALCQRPGGEKPYHLPYAYWVDGPLDVEKLEECMQEIIVRHETLRTCFHELDGELVAQIIPEPRFAIERYEAAEKDLPGIIDRFIRPFDLQTAPLLRMAVIQVAPQRFVLLNDAHHIGIDGLSFNFVVRDLMALYQGQSPPPVQHTFFECAALLEQRVKANQEKLNAFWDKELSGPLPDLALPTDFPRPKEPAYEGDHLLSQMESHELQKLKECARQRRVSLYMLLVAAYTAFLHRLTGQEDILVGTPVAGRNCPEARETVGMFVNTTVLRNFPKPGMPFEAFLDEVKNTCSRVYDHEDYPFERMVERNNTGRPQNRNAIFDTTLTYENGNDRLFQISDLTFTQYPIHDRASMFDFRVEMIEEENCLHMDFQYNTQLFKRETIERWVAYFKHLLIQIERQPTAPLGAMDFLPESETQWLKQCNQTQAAYPQNKTLVDLFNKQVKETPHRTAVICGENRVTYEELDRRANQIATTLQTSHAIQPGDRVGVFLERSDWVIAAFLAILKTGGVYVPLDPEYPTERLRFILKDSECSIVLTQDSVSSLLPKEAQPIARDIQTLSAHEPSTVQATIAVDAPAYVIYTSGSTGQPKGCVVTHRNVVRLLKNERHDFDFNHNDIWSCLHSFSFDFSVWEMYGALLYGGCLAIADKATIQDPSRLLQFIRHHRVTVLNQTPPSFLNLIDREIRETDHNLHDHLRYVIFGGDRLSPASLNPWVDYYSLSCIALINMYGITETTVHVTFYPLQIEDIKNPGGPSPIGRPIPETQVYVCNTMGMQQPIGVTGEMYVGGSGVCQGYLNRPELTHEKFIDSPWGEGKLYKSGDLARRLPNGNLLYLGRNDQQVQIRGHRIELGEIQTHLQHHAAVQKALVVSQENKQGHFELLAYYSKQEDIPVPQFRDFLAQRLPAYMIPSYFIPVRAFPLTANGKIDRQALPHPQTADIEQKTDFRPPRDEIETTMAAVWREVLGVDRVGVHDNYFVLGGDSIKAIQIVSRLFQEGIELEVRHILQSQTIARLREQGKQSPSSSAQSIKSQYGLEDNELQTVLRHLGVNAEQIETILPLTPMQEGILYHSIADENSNAYFEQFTYRIRGPLDSKIFEQTWNKLAKRHTALRTAILFEQTKEPVQAVLRERAIPFTYQDCRHLKQEEQRQKLEELQNQDRHHGFNLSQEPLMRMTVLQMEDGIYEVVWSHHHIILDGWSMSVLVDEFTQ